MTDNDNMGQQVHKLPDGAMTDIDDMQRQIDEATILIGQQEREIERLNMVLENSKHWEAQHLAEIERLLSTTQISPIHVQGLRAEIERLRAACQAVVDTCHGAGAEHWTACELARRALEPKP